MHGESTPTLVDDIDDGLPEESSRSATSLAPKRLSASNLAPLATNIDGEHTPDTIRNGSIDTSTCDTVITAVSSSTPLTSTAKEKLKIVKPTAKIMQSRIYFHQNAELIFLNFEDFYLEDRNDVDLVVKFIELTFINYLYDEELQKNNQSEDDCVRKRANSFMKEKPTEGPTKKTNIDVYVNYDRFYCHESLLDYYSERIGYLELNYYRSVKRFTTETIEDRHVKQLEKILKQQGISDEPVIQSFEMLNGRYIIQRDNLIAIGTFGRVCLGNDKENGELVAIKEVKRKNIDNVEKLKEYIEREMKICKLLSTSLRDDHTDHIGKKYICKFYDVIDTESAHYIVMEFITNGSLDHPYDEKEVFSTETARKYFRQLAQAVHYIHNHLNICHRDIQLANVCIGSNGDIRLVDFGLSDFFTKGIKSHSTFCGNKDYASPEMILSKKYVGYEVDCYALGVLLYKMLVGYFPFRSSIEKIVEQYYIPLEELEREGVLDTQSISLIRGMLEKDPEKRFTTNEIISHDWLREE